MHESLIEFKLKYENPMALINVWVVCKKNDSIH